MYQDELLPIESFEEFCDVNGNNVYSWLLEGMCVHVVLFL